MAKSILNAATQLSPRNIHVIGIGKAGADMVAVMMARAEIEDALMDERARFTSLVVDVGEQDMKAVRKETRSLEMRLQDRGIPLDRVKNLTYSMKIPETQEELDDLMGSLGRVREYLKLEYPRNYWNPNYEPWIDPDEPMPKNGEHISRGLAKALYYDAYYRGELGPMLDEYCKSVLDTKLPSTVYIFFGLGGGVGSGVAVDLARHVATMKLGRRIPVCGFTFLPHELDEPCHKGGNVYVAINELDCQINKEANDGVMAIWGETTRNPWTGGLYAIPRDGAMWRLGNMANNEYSEKNPISAERREHQHIKVANHFVNCIIANFLVANDGAEFVRATAHMGVGANMYLEPNANERSWQFLVPYKWVSPNVEIIPSCSYTGVAEETIRVMNHCEKFTGLREDFKSDYVALYNYLPRNTMTRAMDETLEAVARKLTFEGIGSYNIYNIEAPDEIVCYSIFLLAGVAKTEFKCFYPSREKYDEMSWEERFACHSYLVDLGVMLCEPSIRVQGNAGECIWGCACMIAYPYSKVRGDDEIPKSRVEIWDKAFAGMRAGAMKSPL